MNLGLILAILVLAGFLCYFIIKNGKAEYYLLFTVYCLPLLDLKLIPFDYGNLKVFDIITLIALLIAGGAFFRKFNLFNTYFVFFVLLMTFLVLSSVGSEFRERALLSLFTVVTPFVFCRFLLIEISENPAFILKFFKGLKFTCIVAFVFILMQLLTSPERFTFYNTLNLNVTGGTRSRYPGFFMDAQINGVFFALISFIWLLNFESVKKFEGIQIVMLTLTFGGLMLSGSRSPMMGVAGALIFLAIFLKKNFRFQIFRYVLLGGFVIVLASATTDVFKRFDDMDESISFRQNIWDGALDIFKEHPLLGIGANNYKAYAMRHAQDQSILLDDNEVLYLDFPENGYLKLLVEWGIFAFAFFTLILIKPVYNLLNNYFKGYDMNLAFVFGAMIVCWFISNMSVYTLSDTRIIVLLGSAAAMLAFLNKKELIFG